MNLFCPGLNCPYPFTNTRGSSFVNHKTNKRSSSAWVHRNLFWQLTRGGNLHGSGMSGATTASPKPSFRASLRVDDAVVGRGNAGWTTSKSGHLCPCQNCSKWSPQGKTGRGSLLNRPSCLPEDPIGQDTELNWIFQNVGLLSKTAVLNIFFFKLMVGVCIQLYLRYIKNVLKCRDGVQNVGCLRKGNIMKFWIRHSLTITYFYLFNLVTL